MIDTIMYMDGDEISKKACSDLIPLCTGCGKKSNPLSYFANFQATALNFFMKLCSYILPSYRHTTAKYRLIILKCDKVM